MAVSDLRPNAAAGPRRWRRLNGWSALAFAVALFFALPVVMVASAALTPAGEMWQHLSETVLPRYIANSVILMVGVGIGAAVIGVGTAWLVTMCRFPGQRLFEWALFLPMAVPSYVLAYAYTGLFDVAGPVQDLLR
ncbi:ABC transporter permease, partial [Zavarzinia sp.]|uniref:ABC transporter permease n=1 Tax=Zavarzinia sp. TaxID=2027920 RepID=UPI003562A1E0